jgi:hypothetical protein
VHAALDHIHTIDQQQHYQQAISVLSLLPAASLDVQIHKRIHAKRNRQKQHQHSTLKLSYTEFTLHICEDVAEGKTTAHVVLTANCTQNWVTTLPALVLQNCDCCTTAVCSALINCSAFSLAATALETW